MEAITCGATLIHSQYAVCALHCFSDLANDFEEEKGISPVGTKPLDRYIIVAGAYHSRNYTLHSNSQKFADSEPEYDFQVSTYIIYQ